MIGSHNAMRLTSFRGQRGIWHVAGAMLGLALSIPASAGGLPESAKTYSCEITTTTTLDSRTRTETARVWMKGQMKFRLERTLGGQTMILIGNGPNVWQIDPAHKTGIHRKQTAGALAQLRSQERPVGIELGQFVKLGGKKVGQQTMDGEVCDVYAVTQGQTTAKLWVTASPDKLSKRKEVSRTLDAALRVGELMSRHTMKIVQSYHNWQIGKPIDDSMFKPPAGIKVIEPPSRKK